MQALGLEFGCGGGQVAGQEGRGLTLLKVIVLVPAVALTTTSWVLILMLGAYLSGIHASASSLLGAGLVIAAISGSGLAYIMARRRDSAWA